MLVVVGSLLTMGSIAWELTRMHPQTSYLIEPWSLRGFQSIHGSVIFTIGALILVSGLLTTFEFSLKASYSRAIAALIAVGAIGVAAIYGTDDRVMGGGVIGWALALLAGYILRKAVAKVLPNLLPDLSSTIHSLIGLGVLVLGAFLFNLLLFGGERTAKPWVWVAIVAVLGLGLAVVGQHAELSANRMLIFATVGGWPRAC